MKKVVEYIDEISNTERAKRIRSMLYYLTVVGKSSNVNVDYLGDYYIYDISTPYDCVEYYFIKKENEKLEVIKCDEFLNEVISARISLKSFEASFHYFKNYKGTSYNTVRHMVYVGDLSAKSRVILKDKVLKPNLDYNNISSVILDFGIFPKHMDEDSCDLSTFIIENGIELDNVKVNNNPDINDINKVLSLYI